MYRYAVFFTPRADEPLAEFGRRWFGFDTETRQSVADHWPILSGIIRTPARYGFHATLKAPFRLRKGRAADELMAAVAALAQRLSPVDVGQLLPAELGSFIALRQALPTGAINDLAFTCVRDLDAFREPLTEEEQDAILDKGVTRRQKGNVFAWGYPYVDKDYVFHLTLTSILAPHELAQWRGQALAWGMEYLAEPVVVRDLCVFGQETPDAPFRLLERFALQAP
ncbi:MAG TPA: DUF1045 domain-containing protein [Thermopetrobacter sp.]|nr:DUF1045 domain-containing protein [Thermopetrobacter sp.]